MVRMQDKDLVQGSDNIIIYNVGFDRLVKHHVEEVGAIGKIMARINQGPAHGFLIGECGNSSHLGNKARGHNVNILQRIFTHFGVKVGKRVDHG